MKAWRFAAQNSLEAEQIRQDEEMFRQKNAEKSKTSHKPKVPKYREEDYARPGSVLRNQLKRFQKITRNRQSLRFEEMVAHTQGKSTQSSSSFDRREARRVGRIALEHVEIFKGLPVGRLAELLKFTVFRAGDELIQQGIVGRSLYIVLEGQVSVYVGRKLVALKPVGTIVGERSMIFNKLTTASCRANGRVRCAYLTRTVFLDNCSSRMIDLLIERCRMQDVLSQNGSRAYNHLTALQQQSVYNRIKDLCHRLIREQNARKARRKELRSRCLYLWDRAKALSISVIIRKIPSFRSIKDESTLFLISELMKLRVLKRGERLYSRSSKTKGFYIILSGSFQVRPKIRQNNRNADTLIRIAVRGEVLGVYDAAAPFILPGKVQEGQKNDTLTSIHRFATVRARRRSIVLVVPQKNVEAFLKLIWKDMRFGLLGRELRTISIDAKTKNKEIETSIRDHTSNEKLSDSSLGLDLVQEQSQDEIVRRLVEAAHHHVPGAIVALMGMHPLLSKLPHRESSLLCEGTLVCLRQWGPGKRIVRKGAACESIYFIVHGECSERLADKSGLATVRKGGVFGAGKLFSGGNSSVVRRKDYDIFDTSLVAGAMGVVTMEINQVHLFSLFSNPVLSDLCNAATLSYEWRRKRKSRHDHVAFLNNAESDFLKGDVSGNSRTVIEARQVTNETNPIVNLGTLVMVRAGVGKYPYELPERLRIPGFKLSAITPILVQDNEEDSAFPSKSNSYTSQYSSAVEAIDAERRSKGLATARVPIADSELHVPHIPNISGGRVATESALGTLARSVWHLRETTPIHSKDETCISVLKAPLNHQHEHKLGSRRPMTKRIRYHQVPWYGPRVKMAKAWTKEIKPSTRGGKALSNLTVSSQYQGNDNVSKKSGNIEMTGSKVGTDTMEQYLDPNVWPALSRAGNASRVQFGFQTKRNGMKAGHKRGRKSARKPLLPSIAQGSLIKIGNRYYPSSNRRMR